MASTRLRPSGLAAVIQTRWHRDDLSGKILPHAEEYGQRWRQICFPAIAEAKDDLGREPGEALWEATYSRERLLRMKAARTAYYWQSLYQQNPQAEGGVEWPDDFFGKSIWFDEWPLNYFFKAVALDPSKGTDSKFGDYSAFAKVMLATDGNLYVDADLAIRHTSIIVDTALEIQRTFHPGYFGVEVNQFQQLLASDILTQCGGHRMLLPLYELDNRVTKEVRIRRLTPYLSQGTLRFKGDSPGARLLVRQLRDFPCGDHDDGPDPLEMAIRLISNFACEPEERVAGHICGDW